MTDNKQKQIVKALRTQAVKASRICADKATDCRDCPYNGKENGCEISLVRDAADMIEHMAAELEQIKRERDAAIADLSIDPHCETCKDAKVYPISQTCIKCSEKIVHHKTPNDWTWRGLCDENGGESK